MTHPAVSTESAAFFPVNLKVTWLTDEQFEHLCAENPELRLELTAQGELIGMPSTGSETGWSDSEINAALNTWAKKDGTGLTFGSSTGFTLPNGAKRSPDASWVRRERWSTLTKEQRRKFAPLCPDFVLELCSPTDSLPMLQEKMQEYLDNGARLGWLLDPLERRVHVYQPGQLVLVLDDPETIDGDPILPDFVLPVRELWEPPE
ncbi:MAG: Uma2 family endonuclease [Deltaproteobacteria bacterium]|nr:Uma2 family endonuclease [Deltaproteobacteria bacterium]